MKNLKLFIVLFALTAFTFSAKAQLTAPQPSPLTTLNQRVGLTDIVVTYSRPSMKGRTIYGDLVPYGELWRTGANMATKISFSDDVLINGKELSKGEYAIFSIPNKDEWVLIFNKNVNQSGTAAYSEELDALRLTIKPTALNDTRESFTIEFDHFELDGAQMNISWENTMVSMNVKSDVDSKMEAQINRVLNPATQASQYYQAASYYLDSNKDLNQALTWINKALALYKEAGREPFWVIHVKAKIQAALGQSKEAIKTAEYSKELASKADTDFGYVALNDKLIAEIKKKK